MEVKTAEFICSSPNPNLCPKTDKPEFAFIGRSNVGKSSLINMLTNRKKLAKTSATPGKTQLINHFLINGQWYLVDLPGYGYAKTSKTTRLQLTKMINTYIANRQNLYCVFVLVDSRHEPMATDLEIINQLGQNNIPLSIVFTKSDKLPTSKLNLNLKVYKKELYKTWEELPELFLSSAVNKEGKDGILDFIGKSMSG